MKRWLENLKRISKPIQEETVSEAEAQSSAAVNGLGEVRGLHAGDKQPKVNHEAGHVKPSRKHVSNEDYMLAVAECNRAMKEWKNALHKLDWAVEPDQIDYAIYSVIAAEKHYSTLLKETKRMQQQLVEARSGV